MRKIIDYNKLFPVIPTNDNKPLIMTCPYCGKKHNHQCKKMIEICLEQRSAN